MGAAERLDGLRRELEKRFGGVVLPRPGEEAGEERPGFRTGVDALDRLVPGGVPRGTLSLWTGEATSGRTAALRRLVEEACRAGARVALVDASRTLDAADWCGEGVSPAGLWVARPPDAGRAGEGAWAAEALLRTGAFDLVALDGALPAPPQAHRLRALAREADAALVVCAQGEDPGWRADLKVEFHRAPAGWGLRPGARFRRRAGARVAKGWGIRHGEREVELVHEPSHRLRPGPRVADRRPAARA